MKTVIVRYGEVALKSEIVRRRFEQRLIDNIKLSLGGLDHDLRRERGRIFIDTNSVGTTLKRLSKVPGIVSVSPSIRVDATMDSIHSATVKVASKILSQGMSFAVRTSRVGKHAFSSRDVNERVGSAILTRVDGTRVNLSAPEREISIEVRGKDAYVFAETRNGVGGLPVGTQGKIAALFSSGLNSWVAVYLVMKRGSMALPVFPDPRPSSDDQMYKLAIRAARRLACFYPKLDLRVFPSHGLIRTSAKVAPDLAYCIYKRAMLRATEAIAEQAGADAIVADEGLEQIAWEGLANLRVIDEACRLPVLRPLAGMSENDIVQTARSVGLPEQFVKQLGGPFPPPPSSTSLKIEEVREIEGKLKIDSSLEDALSKVKTIKVRSEWT